MRKKIYVLLISVILFTAANSCSKNLSFHDYFNGIKNSGFIDGIREIRYYGPLRGGDNKVKHLILDSISSYLNSGRIYFTETKAFNPDTMAVKRLYLLMFRHEKKFNITTIEREDRIFKIYFNLKDFDKNTLPLVSNDTYPENEKVYEGMLIFAEDNLPDTTLIKDAVKISDGWYFCIKEK